MPNKDAMKQKAREIQEEAKQDSSLSEKLKSKTGEVISDKILNPIVLSSSKEPTKASAGCTCLPGFSCGSGCQGLVGIIEGTYGCESGNPI